MMTPQEWRKIVIDSYGSIANFSDAQTVTHVRAQIATKRAQNRELIDIEEQHPGALGATHLEEIKSTEAELIALDDELAAWQENAGATAAS